MLNRDSNKPLYIQLADHLREQILSGEIQVGDKLPSESEMIREYQLGRLTVRDALSILANENLIKKHHGKGTFCISTGTVPKRRVDLLLNLSDMYFTPHYLHAICSVLDEKNVNVVLSDTQDDAAVIASLLERIANEGSDGVLFQPDSTAGAAPESLVLAANRLTDVGIPFIMIDSAYENIPQSCVIFNEELSGKIAANYFQSMGHTHLAMIVRESSADSILRQQGFCHAAKNPPYIIPYQKDLKNALVKMRRTHPEITAVFCYNDRVAQKCYEAFDALSLTVAQDISLIGVDDTVIASTLTPPLTSIMHPKERLGETAANAIHAMLLGEEKWPYYKVFEPALNIRKSCKMLSK